MSLIRKRTRKNSKECVDMEHNYDFRKEMLQFHRPSLRQDNYIPEANELKIDDGFSIVYLANSGEVVETAAEIFQP